MRSTPVALSGEMMPPTSMTLVFMPGEWIRLGSGRRLSLSPDVARLRPIAFDLTPKPRDLHVDGPIVDLVTAQARKVEEPLACENARGRTEQGHEKIELPAGFQLISKVVTPTPPTRLKGQSIL